MSRNKNTDDSGVDVMPSSITELQPIIEEFINKLKTIESEIELLKQDKQELVDEYSSKIDMKTLKNAMRVAAIKEKVERKETFESFCEILDRI